MSIQTTILVDQGMRQDCEAVRNRRGVPKAARIFFIFSMLRHGYPGFEPITYDFSSGVYTAVAA